MRDWFRKDMVLFKYALLLDEVHLAAEVLDVCCDLPLDFNISERTLVSEVIFHDLLLLRAFDTGVTEARLICISILIIRSNEGKS